MKRVEQRALCTKGLFGVLWLSTLTLPAISLASAPTDINAIESSVKSAQSVSASGGTDSEKRSIIEDVIVDKGAQPTGDNKLEQSSLFQLNGVSVQGNTVMDKDSIIALVQPYVGTMVNSANLQEIATSITNLFIDQGYGTSKCVIPEQQVAGGVVVLKVIEGRLGQIQLSGEETYRYDSGLFLSQLYDLQGEVIHLPTLNARIRYLSRLPSTRVQPTLVKESESTTNLILKLKGLEDNYSLLVDNMGSRYTGANRLSYSTSLNNFSGNSDVLAINATVSLSNVKHLGSVGLNYKRPVGDSGGKLGFNYSNLYYQMDPNETKTEAIIYEGGSNTMGLIYTQPFWFKDQIDMQESYSWSVGFERKAAQSRSVYNLVSPDDVPLGAYLIDTEDLLIVGEASLMAEKYSSLRGLRGRTFGALTLKHAFEGMFGSVTQEDIDRKQVNITNGIEPTTGPMGNVTGMDPNFWKLYLDASRVQALPGSFTGSVQFHGEYTPSKKVPQIYKFADADGGSSGFSLNLKLMRPISPNLSFGASVKHANAISWFRDENPGCRNRVGTAQAISAGRNSCSNNDMTLNVDWSLGGLRATANYVVNVSANAANDNRVTFNLGYGG